VGSEVTLSPVLSRREEPFAKIVIPQIYGNALRVYPGKYNGVPSYWKPVGVWIVYTASADVANRYLVVRIMDNNAFVTSGVMSTVIVANDAKTFIIDGVVNLSTMTPYADESAGLAPDGMIFGGDDFFQVITIDGHANDVIKVVAKFKFMNWDLGMESGESALTPIKDYWK